MGYYSVIDTLGTKSSNDSEARKIITEIRYVYLDKLDSIIKYYPSKKYGTVYLDIKKDTATVNLKEGFWPAIGENVLTVFDSTGEISLFASFEDETNYQFWSPYHSTSWVTIFYASKPFVTDTTVQFLPQQMELDLQKKASDSGYEFASFYRCKIGKKDFWSYLSEMTVPNIKKD
ncbi:MAG: hypothetical protein IPH66_06705 [Crocinitomicaceae bacterium]|nr:hypothetical protein [Crocinitomicaceae bacterium]